MTLSPVEVLVAATFGIGALVVIGILLKFVSRFTTGWGR